MQSLKKIRFFLPPVAACPTALSPWDTLCVNRAQPLTDCKKYANNVAFLFRPHCQPHTNCRHSRGSFTLALPCSGLWQPVRSDFQLQAPNQEGTDQGGGKQNEAWISETTHTCGCGWTSPPRLYTMSKKGRGTEWVGERGKQTRISPRGARAN